MKLRSSIISLETGAQSMVNMETQKQRELIPGWFMWLEAVSQGYAWDSLLIGRSRAPVLVLYNNDLSSPRG